MDVDDDCNDYDNSDWKDEETNEVLFKKNTVPKTTSELQTNIIFWTESLCLLLMQIPSISNGTMTELQTLPRRFWSCGRTWNCTMSYSNVQEVWHPKMVGSQLTRHSNSKCQLPSLRQLPPYRRIIFTGTRTKRNAMNSIAMLTFFASAKTFVES